MIKRLVLPVLLISLLIINLSYAVTIQPEVQPQTFSSEEISVFEKKFKEIDVHINYLKGKAVDYNDILTMYSETDKIFRELKTSPDIKDINLAREHLKLKLDILEDKVKQRVSYVRRMDFMYQTMTILGMGIIVFMAAYSIYMYARRK